MLDAPFPWFGGKRRVAAEVWQRFGDVPNYVEPFFGSGAVMLNRPHSPRIETVNDKDGFVANFWRAVRADPEQTAYHADWPVNENDLHARHAWLLSQRESLSEYLEGDPEFFDPKIAGWWVWGVCAWIGSGFCEGNGPWRVVEGKLVHLGNAGRGVNRQLVHLGDAGRGVNRKLVHLGDAGQGVWFTALSERLRRTRICSGDWARVVTDSVTHRHGLTAVFLDPPYATEEWAYQAAQEPVSVAVREWAIEAGKNPLMRIALCGYEGEHDMPSDWEVHAYKGKKGYAAAEEALENLSRERIWFSPACLKGPQQGALL